MEGVFMKLIVMVTTSTTFFVVNRLINKLPAPPRYAEVGRRHKWRNAMVSVVHALTVTILAVISVYSTPELLTDPLNVTCATVVLSAIISQGYFIYDSIDLAVTTKLKDVWPLLFHHVLSVAISIWFLSSGKLHGLCCLFSVGIEFNGIFLQGRYILLMWDYQKEDLIYKVNGALNVTTFIIRICMLSFDTWWLFAHTAETGYFLPFPIGVILILNVVLFYRLLKSDYLGKQGGKYSKQADIMVG